MSIYKFHVPAHTSSWIAAVSLVIPGSPVLAASAFLTGSPFMSESQEEILVIPGKVFPALDLNACTYCSAELNPEG